MRYLVILVLVLVNCSISSDVVPIGADAYAVTVKSLPCGLRSAGPAKEVAQRTAADFCKANGKEFAPTETISLIGVPLVHCATVELRFRCGDKPPENEHGESGSRLDHPVGCRRGADVSGGSS